MVYEGEYLVLNSRAKERLGFRAVAQLDPPFVESKRSLCLYRL